MMNKPFRPHSFVAAVVGLVIPLTLPFCVVAVLWCATVLQRGDGPDDDPFLIAAIERGDEPAVRRFLARGTAADVKASKTGVTPLMWAARRGRVEMMEVLL